MIWRFILWADEHGDAFVGGSTVMIGICGLVAMAAHFVGLLP